MLKNYRHGDMGLFGVKELPFGLREAKTKVIMTGSGGNGHTFDNGELFFTWNDNVVIGYLVAKNTKLYHKEHGVKVKGKRFREAKIADGLYKLVKQVEHTHEGMKPVQD